MVNNWFPAVVAVFVLLALYVAAGWIAPVP